MKMIFRLNLVTIYLKHQGLSFTLIVIAEVPTLKKWLIKVGMMTTKTKWMNLSPKTTIS
jgi:hypothetical protein